MPAKAVVRTWRSVLPTVREGDWPTLVLFVTCLALWAAALSLSALSVWLGFAVLVPALVLHSSLSHEILHGHPFTSARAGTVLGLVQPGLAIPYLRFKRMHLEHHVDAKLTDPYDDPETNYLDPEVWRRLSGGTRALLRFNNTLLGRMLIGPAVAQYVFMRGDLRRIRAGNLQVLGDWLLHVPGVALVLGLVYLSPTPMWTYVLACYAALGVLKIRTFLEHQAHARCSARTVVVEDRGVLAFLFLNNNLHVVHHMYPSVPWHHLPALYRSQKDRFLRRNQGYVFRSYGTVFRQFLCRTKDPVAHPLWRGPRN